MADQDTPAPIAGPETGALLEFMFRLGQAHLACGEAVAQVELLLRRMAAAYGVHRVRVIVFPTALFISLDDGVGERVTVAEGPAEPLRLDQMAAVYALGEAAERGSVAPREGLDRLTAILGQAPRFGAVGVIGGHIVLTLGLALLLTPTLANLAAAGALGAIVGALKVANRDRPVLAVPLPVVAALIVSALVFLAVKYGLPIDPLYVLVPPLITFLPGAMLTLAMVELAYGDMVSGSSRLITGFVQLVLLAFGLAAGAAMVGVGSAELLRSGGPLAGLPWVPWVGVLVFGFGMYLHFSAPPNSLLWIWVVLVLAFAAQRLGTGVFGPEISGFFGMLVATPLGYLIQRRFNGPPAMVTFLPSFWLVVPGALGLLSVTRMLSERAAGLDGLVTVVFVLVSIALGTLVGASLYKWLSEKFDGWWPRLGRVRLLARRGGDRDT
jgi:uncharacterized membrane protein YjjP (DUF1212 family)/uncharacterized membrane protein YjjB (DUF3815 family)